MADPLRELLRRADDPEPRLTADDLDGWPRGVRAALKRLGVLAEVEPVRFAICGSCPVAHGGEVIWSHVPGRRPRAFVPCPENGRDEIDPEQLRRWTLPPGGIARAVAAALGITAPVEERSPGRVWKLGTFRGPDRVWSGFFAAGLYRADAGSVVAPLTELRAANAVVVVPSVPPVASVWGDSAPVVVSLADVLSLGDGRMSLDRLALDSALTPKTAPVAPRTVVFPTPPDATWDRVE